MDDRSSEIEQLCIDYAHLPARVSVSIARGLPGHVQPEELESAAWEGLYLAAASWSPEGGDKFHRWAWRKISGCIIDELRRNDSVSRAWRANAKKVFAAEDELRVKLSREPTDKEVMEKSGLTESQWREHRIHIRSGLFALTLDDGILGNYIASPVRVGEGRLDVEKLEWVEAAIRALPEVRKRVMTGLFYEGVSRKQLCAELGVSESRISQLISDARGMLKMAIDVYVFDKHIDPSPSAIAEKRRKQYLEKVLEEYQNSFDTSS